VHRISDDTFGVRCCNDCGAGFLSPRPAAGDIGNFYPREFYWTFEKSAEVPLTAADLLARRSVQVANKLRCMAHLKSDVCSMSGHEGRVSVRGPAARLAGRRSRVLGLCSQSLRRPIRYGEFLDMDFAAGSVDCVTMWAVL